MPRPNQDAVLKALEDFISFGREIGLPKAIEPIEAFAIELRITKPTRSLLEDKLYPILCQSFTGLQDRVVDTRRKPRPGMKKHEARLYDTYNVLFDIIFPPKHADLEQTEIIGLAGNKESTSVLGDTKEAKGIAKASLDVVCRFSKAVFKLDIESAYKLCANELRCIMSVEQFVATLKRADSRFGGAAVELVVEHIPWIYADAASRKRSNVDGDWPKETPKPNKRALVGTFWFVDKSQKRGRSVFFWITEEAEGFRIAKFKQYLQ